MFFTPKITHLALVISTLLATPTTASSSCCDNGPIPKVDYQQLAKNYLAIWGGDMSLIDSVIHPDVALIADRLPSAQGGSTLIQVTSREQYTAFVDKSRSGWKEYDFDIIHLIAGENQFAVRWKMNGITSANMTLPTPNSTVTYNGTGIVLLDECTGLVREVQMSQDFIAFFHALVLKAVSV